MSNEETIFSLLAILTPTSNEETILRLLNLIKEDKDLCKDYTFSTNGALKFIPKNINDLKLLLNYMANAKTSNGSTMIQSKPVSFSKTISEVENIWKSINEYDSIPESSLKTINEKLIQIKLSSYEVLVNYLMSKYT